MKKEYYLKKCKFIWERDDMDGNTHMEDIRYALWLIDNHPKKRALGQCCTDPEAIEKRLIGLLTIIPRKKNYFKIITKLYGKLSKEVKNQKYELVRLSITANKKGIPAVLEFHSNLLTKRHKRFQQSQIFHRQGALVIQENMFEGLNVKKFES